MLGILSVLATGYALKKAFDEDDYDEDDDFDDDLDAEEVLDKYKKMFINDVKRIELKCIDDLSDAFDRIHKIYDRTLNDDLKVFIDEEQKEITKRIKGSAVRNAKRYLTNKKEDILETLEESSECEWEDILNHEINNLLKKTEKSLNKKYNNEIDRLKDLLIERINASKKNSFYRGL